MSVGSLIFLLLIVGSFLAMFSMHRGGGHSHGGFGGGCGGGHGGHGGHGGRGDDDVPAAEHSGHEQRKPLLGPPGTKSGQPVPADAEPRRHRGC